MSFSAGEMTGPTDSYPENVEEVSADYTLQIDDEEGLAYFVADSMETVSIGSGSTPANVPLVIEIEGDKLDGSYTDAIEPETALYLSKLYQEKEDDGRPIHNKKDIGSWFKQVRRILSGTGHPDWERETEVQREDDLDGMKVEAYPGNPHTETRGVFPREDDLTSF